MRPSYYVEATKQQQAKHGLFANSDLKSLVHDLLPLILETNPPSGLSLPYSDEMIEILNRSSQWRRLAGGYISSPSDNCRFCCARMVDEIRAGIMMKLQGSKVTDEPKPLTWTRTIIEQNGEGQTWSAEVVQKKIQQIAAGIFELLHNEVVASRKGICSVIFDSELSLDHFWEKGRSVLLHSTLYDYDQVEGLRRDVGEQVAEESFWSFMEKLYKPKTMTLRHIETIMFFNALEETTYEQAWHRFALLQALASIHVSSAEFKGQVIYAKTKLLALHNPLSEASSTTELDEDPEQSAYCLGLRSGLVDKHEYVVVVLERILEEHLPDELTAAIANCLAMFWSAEESLCEIVHGGWRDEHARQSFMSYLSILELLTSEKGAVSHSISMRVANIAKWSPSFCATYAPSRTVTSPEGAKMIQGDSAGYVAFKKLKDVYAKRSMLVHRSAITFTLRDILETRDLTRLTLQSAIKFLEESIEDEKLKGTFANFRESCDLSVFGEGPGNTVTYGPWRDETWLPN